MEFIMSKTIAEFDSTTKGLLNTFWYGNVNLSATLGDIFGTLPVAIPSPPATGCLVVTPNLVLTYPGGPATQLTATVTYRTILGDTSYDVTNLVDWSSAKPAIATVTSGGLVSGVAVGTTPVVASVGYAVAYAYVKVVAVGLVSIDITPDPVTIHINEQQQFTATGTYSDGSTANITKSCTWFVVVDEIASITTQGLATGLVAGSVVVAAVDPVTSKVGYGTLIVDATVVPGGGGGGEGGWAAGGPGVFMCCESWPTLLYWSRYASEAMIVPGSPAGTKHICWRNGYLYALSNDNYLYFSDASNPFLWPTNNRLPLSLNLGAPRFLKSMQDRVYIFCANGVQYLIGTPDSDPYIDKFLNDLPCTKGPVLFYGTDSFFISYDCIMDVGNSSTSLTSKLPGMSLQLPLNTWSAVSPDYLIYRTKASDDTTLLYVYNRNLGVWGQWTYAASSVLGDGDLDWLFIGYGLVVGERGFVLPSFDGNIYLQPIRSAAEDINYPLWSKANTDLGIPICNEVSTRFTGIGDDLLVNKQLRRFALYGYGTGLQLLFKFVNNNNEIISYAPTLNTTALPVEQPTCLDDLPCATWQELQMQISGYNMYLRGIQLVWRPLRYGLNQL
jgi:hypothetical protein